MRAFGALTLIMSWLPHLVRTNGVHTLTICITHTYVRTREFCQLSSAHWSAYYLGKKGRWTTFDHFQLQQYRKKRCRQIGNSLSLSSSSSSSLFHSSCLCEMNSKRREGELSESFWHKSLTHSHTHKDCKCIVQLNHQSPTRIQVHYTHMRNVRGKFTCVCYLCVCLTLHFVCVCVLCIYIAHCRTSGTISWERFLLACLLAELVAGATLRRLTHTHTQWCIEEREREREREG